MSLEIIVIAVINLKIRSTVNIDCNGLNPRSDMVVYCVVDGSFNFIHDCKCMASNVMWPYRTCWWCGCKENCKNRRISIEMNGRTNERTDRWMDEWIHFQCNFIAAVAVVLGFYFTFRVLHATHFIHLRHIAEIIHLNCKMKSARRPISH